MIAHEKKILPAIVEKDYWIMHTLWGLQQKRFDFELKGGTSLSKGFGIIHRFSEDIDIKIHPKNSDNVKTGKNQDKATHIESRRNFFDTLCSKLPIQNMSFERDSAFDDKKFFNVGIRGIYHSFFPSIGSLKNGILLELGFDKTTPYLEKDISSWAYDKVKEHKISVIDNRALGIKCYCPEYTFVEKLQAISTKFRKHQYDKKIPANFLRHYYDVYQLLANERVMQFIGTAEYYLHKENRFGQLDEKNLALNEAFKISDENIRSIYVNEYMNKKELYFNQQPSFEEIIERIQTQIQNL